MNKSFSWCHECYKPFKRGKSILGLCPKCKDAGVQDLPGSHDPKQYDANLGRLRALRTPTWADKKKVQQVYDNCPEDMEVDHIYPLRGEKVSGLHVHNNLQYLTPEDNNKKRNKFKIK